MPDHTILDSSSSKAVAGIATVTTGQPSPGRTHTVPDHRAQARRDGKGRPRIRFGVVGADHGHVYR